MTGNVTKAIAKDFYKQMARYCDGNAKDAESYWQGALEAICRTIYLEGKVDIPGLGRMFLTHKEESVVNRTEIDGTKSSYYIPPRDYPNFDPEDDFINDINFTGVTKKYRYRARMNALTNRDYLRIRRANEVNGAESQDIFREKEEHKERFADFLKQKIETFNERKSTEDEVAE